MTLVLLPFFRQRSHFTLMFEKHILNQCKNGTISGASKILREHDTRIWRVLIYYVKECRKQAYFLIRIVIYMYGKRVKIDSCLHNL